ncbi:MAG: enoyl-CoA hydratase-related protein, partial [Thermoflexales bacterium]
ADVCLALGLTNKVVAHDSLPAEARAWALRLAQRPNTTLALTKRAMNRAMESGLMEMIDYEAHLQQMAAETDDFTEGTTAFREKRAAKFVK